MVKRNKRSRLRGLRTCGRGSRKKGRGSGQRGGVGMAGTGKKAGQKIIWLLKNYPDGYLGKSGFRSLGQKFNRKSEAINLADIEKRMPEFEKKGLLKGKELNLSGYKVLGDGDLTDKLSIKADGFSSSARKKIEAAGGKIVEESE